MDCEGRAELHPRVVGGRNRTTGLPRVGDVEGLATGLRSFCILSKHSCLFFGGFYVNMIVAHGMGLNCIGGRYMKGMVWANDDRMCMGSGYGLGCALNERVSLQ